MGKKKRRRMNKFRMDEISAVDTPAQSGAKAVIMKRATSVDDIDHYLKRQFSAEQRRQMASSGQAMSDGAFPIANGQDLNNAIRAFGRADNKSAVARHIARRARALGLTDRLPSEGELANLIGKRGDKSMSKELEAKMAKMQEKLDANDAALIKANALAEMNDEHKAFYKSLSESDQKEFLEKSVEDRESQIEKASDKGDQTVVYTSLDGTEFTKSDDPRLVAMAKRSDNQEKELAKAKAKNADNELRKRAETEFQYLPGDVDVRMALIKSAEDIQNDDLRKKALEALKAQNTEMKKAFDERGTSQEPNTFGKGADQGDAEEEMENLTKSRMQEKGEDYYTAYDFVKTANPDIYAKAVGH